MNDIVEQCRRMPDQWFAEPEDLFTSAAHHFGRREMQDRALDYLIGPLRPAERKNGWQPAEATDHASPYSVQHLLLRCTPHMRRPLPDRLLQSTSIGSLAAWAATG